MRRFLALASILFLAGCNTQPGTSTSSNSSNGSSSSNSGGSGNSGNSASPVLNVSGFQIVYNTEANTASGSFDASITNPPAAGTNVNFSFNQYPAFVGEEDNGGTMTVYFNNVGMGADTYPEACQDGVTVWASFNDTNIGLLGTEEDIGQHVSIDCSGGDEQRPVGRQIKPRP